MNFGLCALFFLVIPTLILTVLVLSQRRRLRAAGIDRANPGCPNCLYQYQGWAGTVCPECGNDVAMTGVQVGTTAYWALKLIVLAGATFFIVVIVASLVISPLTTRRDRERTMGFVAATAPAYRVNITAHFRNPGFFGTDEMTTILEFWPPGDESGLRLPSITLRAEPSLDENVIQSAILEVAGDSALERMEAQTRELLTLVGQVQAYVSTDGWLPIAPEKEFRVSSGSSGRSESTDPWGILLPLVLASIATSVVSIIVARRRDSGIRSLERMP